MIQQPKPLKKNLLEFVGFTKNLLKIPCCRPLRNGMGASIFNALENDKELKTHAVSFKRKNKLNGSMDRIIHGWFDPAYPNCPRGTSNYNERDPKKTQQGLQS